MTPHTYTASINWACPARDADSFASGTYSRAHVWRFDGDVEVPASASPLVVPVPLSCETSVDPEEAFVASVASCHMLWFIDLARRDGHVIIGYSDAPQGVMQTDERGRTAITDVTLRPQVTVLDPNPDAERLMALHIEAHERCFIANSIKSAVHLAPGPVRGVVQSVGHPEQPDTTQPDTTMCGDV